VSGRLLETAIGYCNLVKRVSAHANRIAARNSRFAALLLGVVCLAVAGCQGSSQGPVSLGITPAKHTWFNITTGTAHELGKAIAEGQIQCQSCHPADTSSFTQIQCGGCHGHDSAVTDRLHLTVPGYDFKDSSACYSCHPTGARVDFDHAGITNNCAACHDVGNPFAALPKANFTHPETGGVDCSGCHNTTDWAGAAGAPNAHNAANDIVVATLLPTFAGTSIVNLAAQSETLSMTMNHGSTDATTAVMSDCSGCHPNANKSGFFPGSFHQSLSGLGLAQPTSCASCHLDAMPTGFVGPTATSPARMPPSGEMRHDAVAWVSDAPSSARIVSTNCGICHHPADNNKVTWATAKSGSGAVQFHASLNNTGMPQPASCLDCHANSRPLGVLTKTNSALSAGISFDHATAPGDCAACHATTAAPSFSSWKLGRFHLSDSTTPPTCLPCHGGERPAAADSTWISTTYKNSPFDYGTNAAGSTHGDGQDCVLCHSGPGTGAWGGTQTWASGHFDHGPTTPSAQSCIVCHSTQRPDLQPNTTAASAAALLGFDHSTSGSGECLGCHAATTATNRYVDYTNPSTRALPGGDWKGAVSYPGSSFAGSNDQFINVTETALVRDGTTANNVLRTTTVTDTIYNGMLHSSTILPAPLSAGPTNAPDNSKCWHCHTSNNGTVTQFNNGKYHDALTNFRPTPSGAIAAYPQPTSQCIDCHSYMMPDGIVELNGSNLWPMDHKAVLAMPITVNGATVARVSDLDCSFCHKSPGKAWSDGIFHANLPSTAVVSDCNGCHYVLIADTAVADTTSGTLYAMKHLSPLVPDQGCKPCHATGVANRAMLPAVSTLFAGGTFHSSTSVAKQPTGCIDCHLVSQPAANLPTQSTVSYAFKTGGGTATNGPQWMNHGSSLVAGKDCAACHLNDAQATGSAWSRSISLHAAAPLARTCQECHGLVNGGGGVSGTKNNLPSGLTSSTVATSASAATGIPSATLSQITHDDINVASHDCNYCHTQVGVATSAPIQGKEWAQARFHASFPTTTPLTMNGTTGRCSNCHMNDNPKSSYTVFNHSNFGSSSSSTDCSNCHTYPGTGTGASPNWLGGSTGSSGNGGSR